MKNIYTTQNHSLSIFDGSSTESPRDKKQILKKLGNIRKKVESGGVDFNGVLIKTDEGSIAKITSTVMALQSGMMDTIDWKGHNGWIRGVDLDIMMQIAMVVSSHVQKCFRIENTIASEIELMTQEQLNVLDVQAVWDTYFTTE
jgi:hypothetical protein